MMSEERMTWEPTPEAVEAAVDAFELADRPTDDDPNSDFRAAVRAAFAVDEAAIRADQSRRIVDALRREGWVTDEGGPGWTFLLPEGPAAADLIEREFLTAAEKEARE